MKTSIRMIQDKEIALSAEQLLTMFNRKISKNAELLDYIGQNNIFGILDFFNSRRNLVLSVYKIMLEAEHDNNVYEEKLKIYRKLIKP